MRLRDETNLVVSYAKNAKSEEEDISLMEREQRVLPIGIPRAQRLALPPRLHIPTPPYSYNATAEDFYSLLSRESIKQLDADITNDFEKLLVESHNRLYPNAFEPRYPCKAEPTLTSSSEEDETTLCSEKFEEELSLEDGFSYVSEVSSPVTHGSRTLVNSPATSPGHPEYPRTYRKASWTYTTPLSAPILHGRFLRPTFHGSDRYL
ncbi:hypothetical protein BC832DRAFT_121869 [Gaertneriomyces semiglobifer]|nr:hypothetical protein BC832DRAFT_248034 [Gaertneriomyces semiglobifer]KAI9002420.1 hypothetical protein BC832DRAFT_121869 [Gaertneriomyces semiglobifer]